MKIHIVWDNGKEERIHLADTNHHLCQIILRNLSYRLLVQKNLGDGSNAKMPDHLCHE